MYALGAAVLAPVAAGAVLLTWALVYLAASFYLGGGTWVLKALLATAVVGLLFFLNGKLLAARTTRVFVEPGDRDIEEVSLDVPRGTGLTWMMYLTGARDLPGVVRFLSGVTMFGPRLCGLVAELVRRARALWGMDFDALAAPVKTLVKAEGKVSFAAFLEAHRSPPPQDLVRRLSRIDGVLFLPTSTPPGVTASPAMKEEFAQWRADWRRRRAGGGALYD